MIISKLDNSNINNMSSKTIIAIEGNIGVGKSTFIKIISNVINSDIVYEPINSWLSMTNQSGKNILQVFYDDKTKYGFVFQNIAYISRMMSIEDKIKISDKNIIFLDRSLYTDKNIFAKMLFDDGYINDTEMMAYNYWCDFYTNYVRNTGKKNIIYLKCSPESAFKRIQKRGRKEEMDIPFDYIEKVHNYHEIWLNVCSSSNDNILILDCNIDFENNIDYQNEIIKKVQLWISEI